MFFQLVFIKLIISFYQYNELFNTVLLGSISQFNPAHTCTHSTQHIPCENIIDKLYKRLGLSWVELIKQKGTCERCGENGRIIHGG